MEKIFIFSERLEDFFRKDVTYDNIEIKIKKKEKASLSKKCILGKTRWRMSN